MKKNKKILIISEGQDTEPRIYEKHLVKIGLLPDNIFIFSYKASLHDLIQLLEDTKNLDFADFQQSLIERERRINDKDSTEKIEKLREKYTDTILIFDLDPQDPRYDHKKIINLVKIFNESSDNGKLYLSYPMIEALFDNAYYIPLFKKGEYKKRVKNMRNQLYRRFINDQSSFEDYQNMLNQQIKKANRLISYHEHDFHLKLFNVQNSFIANGQIYVISTALFFLVDYWGDKIIKVNSCEELRL